MIPYPLPLSTPATQASLTLISAAQLLICECAVFTCVPLFYRCLAWLAWLAGSQQVKTPKKKGSQKRRKRLFFPVNQHWISEMRIIQPTILEIAGGKLNGKKTSGENCPKFGYPFVLLFGNFGKCSSVRYWKLPKIFKPDVLVAWNSSNCFESFSPLNGGSNNDSK